MDNFGGIFTTLSQTCKKYHCLKNGQRVDSWENDCLRQKDADSVGCLFNPSFVRGRCPRTARLEEVFLGHFDDCKAFRFGWRAASRFL